MMQSTCEVNMLIWNNEIKWFPFVGTLKGFNEIMEIAPAPTHT